MKTNQLTNEVRCCRLQSPLLGLVMAMAMIFLSRPLTAEAQLCLHGIGSQMNVFGTNCAGAAVPGFALRGSTIGFVITANYLDQCGVNGNGDRSVVTNITVGSLAACVPFTSPNLINTANAIPPGNLLGSHVVLDPAPGFSIYGPINVSSGPFGGASYTRTLPPGCTGLVSFIGNVQGYDTNGTSNVGGPLGAQPSANLTVIDPRICVTVVCVTNGFGQNATVTWTGTVTNCGDVALNNVTATLSYLPLGTTNFGPLTLAAGEGRVFSGSYAPVCQTITNVFVASGADQFLGCPVSAQASAVCRLAFNPCIGVTKNCDTVVLGQGNLVSGIVTNCGDITLTNISIVDNLYGTLVSGITLAPGGVQAYSALKTNNTCGNFTNIVTATGTTICGGQVSANATSVCIVTVNPCIRVTKNCDTVALGQGNLVSGVVTNCGDVTLTNISIVDNLYGSIVANLTLAPGASAPYSLLVTNPVCGNFTNIVTASGRSTCGQLVSATATNVCIVTATPCIRVTKNCDSVVLGQGNLVSGVVTNCGNVTLTNISIVDNIYGPIVANLTLAPGASAPYSRLVTNSVCGNYTNIVTAAGRSTCGQEVSGTATNVCIVTENPCIRVTKNCDTVVLGQANLVSGVVTNCGNITLTNISIVDNLYGTLATIPTLAPGATAPYSRLVTNGTCGNFTNIVTATGRSLCGTQVSGNATNVCIVTELACIRVTKNCDTVVLGQANLVSGVVTNCGNVTLTNISIVDNIYGSVGNIASLAPGATAPYSRLVTNSVCGNYTNIVTASGVSPCGTQVSGNATNVCIVTATPCIRVTKNCDSVVLGLGNLVSGVVTNCGNVTLTNISIVDNIYGPIVANLTLAPGATAPYSKLVTNTTCGNYTNIVTAAGRSLCGQDISATATNVCIVTENPCIRVTKNCDTVAIGLGNLVSGVVTNCGNVTLTNISIVDNLYGSIVANLTLAPGASAPYSKLVTNSVCGNFTNVVTATGRSVCGTQVSGTATNVCIVTENPCVRVTKNCDTVIFPALNTVSGVVSNCGNVTLTNIAVVDNVYGSITTIPQLLPGASAPYSKTVSNACGEYPNQVTATGRSICGTQVSAQATNTCRVICPPQICVTKEVVCQLPSGCDTNWSKLAIGVVNGEDCPAFCYRITVYNCGNDALTNVTVVDTNLAAYMTNCNFPTTLAVGQSYTCVIPGVLSCEEDGGTVVACGYGSQSGILVCTNDAAGVDVREISITCDTRVNGEHFIEIPCDGQPHLVTNTIRICNTGDLPLANIRIFAPHLVSLGGACANIANMSFSLAAGACTNIELCVDAPVCDPSCSVAFSNYVQVTASVDLSKTNVCAYTHNATNGLDLITTSTECSAVVGCQIPNACRVTGGGRQDDPIVYPANVRYVTHGGQVGAPVGNRVCEVTDDFYLGNPCIHGRWTHVRHQKGGLRGNFHARYYDTLECACLDTNLVDGFYAAGTVDGEVCGNRNIGPLPRKAPSNKIVFTGVGDWADPNGRRAPRATLFRVDIEDRGEPGNAHALGANGKEGRVPDRYRIRIWVLTTQELALLRGAGTGSDKYLKGFRNAISACNGMTAPDGAVNGAGARVSIANGTAVFGVRAPDIDDGGEMLHGNHQIHPAIKNCDPYNPTGPGLPPGGN